MNYAALADEQGQIHSIGPVVYLHDHAHMVRVSLALVPSGCFGSCPNPDSASIAYFPRLSVNLSN